MEALADAVFGTTHSEVSHSDASDAVVHSQSARTDTSIGLSAMDISSIHIDGALVMPSGAGSAWSPPLCANEHPKHINGTDLPSATQATSTASEGVNGNYTGEGETPSAEQNHEQEDTHKNEHVQEDGEETGSETDEESSDSVFTVRSVESLEPSTSLSAAKFAKLSVEDEGISMSDTSGKVDFFGSLPLEITLYLLLFSDVRTLCRASQVSKAWQAVTTDSLVWRSYFYRTQGWHLQPDFLKTVEHAASAIGAPSSGGDDYSPFKTPTRAQRSITSVSEGGIASRIGKRLGHLVTEMAHLNLYTRSSPAVQPDTHALSASRNRAASVASSSASHMSRLSTMYTSASPARAALLAAMEDDQTSLSGDIGAYFGSDPLSVQNPYLQSSPPVLRLRSVSASALPSISGPSSSNENIAHSQALELDWKGFYRDRYELQHRWAEAKFANRTLKGHKVSKPKYRGTRIANVFKKDSVYCVALKGNRLLSGSRDWTIKIWRVDTGVLERTIEQHSASVLTIQIDEELMVTGASNGELFVWDIDRWTVKSSLSGHSSGVLDVQMSSKWFASCSKDTSIRIWQRDQLEPYRVLRGHRGPVNAIQLWDDHIASASGDSRAMLWDIESGQMIRVFKGHERGLACIQYNGEVLMTGSNDRNIRIWDPKTGECLKVLKGHKDLVRTLCYDPLRKRLFSGSYDKTTRIWDVETGNLKMTFKSSHSSLVFDVGMDVSRLVSCSHDRRIVVIDFGEGLDAYRFA